MDKQAALDLLKKHVKLAPMIRHSLATWAVMGALAKKLGKDEQLWAAAGLLHDIDIELCTQDIMHTHCSKARALIGAALPDEGICAIEAHNEYANIRPRQTEFDFALAAGETITGLIMAIAFVYPDKKLASVKVKSITKRMKEKSFAASVRREVILECEKLGMTLDDFAALSLNAMQQIAPELDF